MSCVRGSRWSGSLWGNNQHHELGYPDKASIGDDEHPVTASFVDVGEPVAHVTAGHAHTCALLEGGRVRCWGAGSGGRLGYGNTETIGDDEALSTLDDVDVGGKVIQLDASMQHTCALLEGGQVRCWGANLNGRLGYGHHEHIGDDESPASAGDVRY